MNHDIAYARSYEIDYKLQEDNNKCCEGEKIVRRWNNKVGETYYFKFRSKSNSVKKFSNWNISKNENVEVFPALLRSLVTLI